MGLYRPAQLARQKYALCYNQQFYGLPSSLPDLQSSHKTNVGSSFATCASHAINIVPKAIAPILIKTVQRLMNIFPQNRLIASEDCNVPPPGAVWIAVAVRPATTVSWTWVVMVCFIRQIAQHLTEKQSTHNYSGLGCSSRRICGWICDWSRLSDRYNHQTSITTNCSIGIGSCYGDYSFWFSIVSCDELRGKLIGITHA